MAFSKSLLSLLLLGVGVIAQNATNDTTPEATTPTPTTPTPCNATALSGNETCPPTTTTTTSAAPTTTTPGGNTTATSTGASGTGNATSTTSGATTTGSADTSCLDVKAVASTTITTANEADANSVVSTINGLNAANARSLACDLLPKAQCDLIPSTFTFTVVAELTTSRRRSLSKRELSTTSTLKITVTVPCVPTNYANAVTTLSPYDRTAADVKLALNTAVTGDKVSAATATTVTITATESATDTAASGAMSAMNVFNSFMLLGVVAIMQKF